MVSHKHRYIFVHIPKCAGTSVEKFLLDHEGVACDWSFTKAPLMTLSDVDKREYKLHYNAQQHSRLSDYDSDLQREYFCFTFVRNPWERCVSEYLYYSKYTKNTPDPFEEWIVNPVCEPYHMEPQVSFINKNIDYVGKVETISSDYDKICSHIGISPRPLEKLNTSTMYDYRSYYTNTSKNIVVEKYKNDIEQFDYDF